MSEETEIADELPPPPPPIIYKTAFDLQTGALRWVSFGPENIILFPDEPGMGWIDGEWHAATHYVSEGQVVSRPTTGLPETHTVAASTDWAVADVPEGTVVEIDGEIAGTVDATGLTLAFDLAGVWQVSLRAPFPWLDASCEVTVT